MIRSSLLCLLAYISIVIVAEDDEFPMISVCENMGPDDTYINLSNLEIDTINKSFATGNSVTCVNLGGNLITRLEKNTFDRVPKLSYLNLANNPVSFEDFMNLSFPSLRILILDGPFVDQNGTNIENERHDPSSIYYSSDNRIINVHPIFLPNLEKLSLFDYGHNPINTWLDYFNVPNLTHLYIHGNKLTYLDHIEQFTQTLTHLYMDHNYLQTSYMNFTKLRYLSMNDNEIKKICLEFIVNGDCSVLIAPKLEYLSLKGNKIVEITPGAFDNLINLRFLNVTSNKILHLPTKIFYSMQNLRNLSLAQNSMTEMPNFCSVGQREILILKRNEINTIEAASSCNLTQLSFIDLSHNNLTSVPNETFVQLSGLTILDISWNNITTLPKNWTKSGQVLHFLNLDGNSFKNIDSMSLESIGRLDTLSIGHNPLKWVKISLLANLQPEMSLDVSRSCD